MADRLAARRHAGPSTVKKEIRTATIDDKKPGKAAKRHGFNFNEPARKKRILTGLEDDDELRAFDVGHDGYEVDVIEENDGVPGLHRTNLDELLHREGAGLTSPNYQESEDDDWWSKYGSFTPGEALEKDDHEYAAVTAVRNKEKGVSDQLRQPRLYDMRVLEDVKDAAKVIQLHIDNGGVCLATGNTHSLELLHHYLEQFSRQKGTLFRLRDRDNTLPNRPQTDLVLTGAGQLDLVYSVGISIDTTSRLNRSALEHDLKLSITSQGDLWKGIKYANKQLGDMIDSPYPYQPKIRNGDRKSRFMRDMEAIRVKWQAYLEALKTHEGGKCDHTSWCALFEEQNLAIVAQTSGASAQVGWQPEQATNGIFHHSQGLVATQHKGVAPLAPALLMQTYVQPQATADETSALANGVGRLKKFLIVPTEAALAKTIEELKKDPIDPSKTTGGVSWCQAQVDTNAVRNSGDSTLSFRKSDGEASAEECPGSNISSPTEFQDDEEEYSLEDDADELEFMRTVYANDVSPASGKAVKHGGVCAGGNDDDETANGVCDEVYFYGNSNSH